MTNRHNSINSTLVDFETIVGCLCCKLVVRVRPLRNELFAVTFAEMDAAFRHGIDCVSVVKSALRLPMVCCCCTTIFMESNALFLSRSKDSSVEVILLLNRVLSLSYLLILDIRLHLELDAKGDGEKREATGTTEKEGLLDNLDAMIDQMMMMLRFFGM